MPTTHEGLIAMSPDELLSALFAAQDRIAQLERFRSNVASIVDNWNADRCSDRSAIGDVAIYLREVSP